MKEKRPRSLVDVSSHQTSGAPWSRRQREEEEGEEELAASASRPVPPSTPKVLNSLRNKLSVPPALSRHPSTFCQQSSSVEEGAGQGNGDLEGGEGGEAVEDVFAAAGVGVGVGGPGGGGGKLLLPSSSPSSSRQRPFSSPALSATKSLKLAKRASP